MKLRLTGAALVLLGGGVHTWLAFDGYGPAELVEMFFINGLASALAAGALAVTRGWLAAIAGIGISAMSLFAFLLSRVGDGVLGFRGRGVDPAPEALLTLVFEAAAFVVLSLVVLERREEIFGTLRAAVSRGRTT